MLLRRASSFRWGFSHHPSWIFNTAHVQLFFALGLACRACKIVVTVFGKRNQVTLVRVIQAQHAAAASSSGPEQSQDLGRTRRSPVGLEDGRLASVHPGLIQADKVEL